MSGGVVTRKNASMLLWLTLILVMAAVLRILHIDQQSLWIDEGFTWHLTQAPDPLHILSRDVHPPLYFLLADAWVALAGDSVLAMRFLSVLPGLLSVAVIVPLSRELLRWHNSVAATVPLLAALLLALLDAEIFLAQEARSYTLQTLLVLLSMWGMLRWSRCGGRGWLLLWILSLTALVYTFYLAALIGVAQGVWVLLTLRGRRRLGAVVALIAAALLVVPWLLLTLGAQTDNLSYADWIRLSKHGVGVIADLVLRWFGQMWPLTLLLALLALVHVDYTGDRWRLRLRPASVGLLLALWLLLPLVLTFIANEALPLYQPRRVNIISGAVVLLIAFGLGNVQRPARWLLVAALVLYGLTTVDFWRDKLPWRTMAAATAPLMQADSALLLELGGDEYAPRYHYQALLPDDVTVRGLTSWRKFEPETYESGLPAIIDAHDTVWLFYWGSDTSALAWLDELNFIRTWTYTVDFNPDVYLYRYDRLPDEPVASYANGLLLRNARFYPDLRADLLWSSDAPLTSDYVTSAFLLDAEGRLVAQQDSTPQPPPSRWEPGAVIYDPKQMQPVDGAALPPGDYRLGVVVYEWVAGQPQRVPLAGGADSLLLGTLTLP